MRVTKSISQKVGPSQIHFQEVCKCNVYENERWREEIADVSKN